MVTPSGRLLLHWVGSNDLDDSMKQIWLALQAPVHLVVENILE